MFSMRSSVSDIGVGKSLKLNSSIKVSVLPALASNDSLLISARDSLLWKLYFLTRNRKSRKT